MTSPQLKNRSNYEIIDPLGGGAFGTVYKIKIHEDQKIFALKNVELTRPDALAEAKMEYDLLRKGIPNVLKSFGSYHEPNKKFIFSTELMETTLENHIQGKGPLSFGQFAPMFKDILRGKN